MNILFAVHRIPYLWLWSRKSWYIEGEGSSRCNTSMKMITFLPIKYPATERTSDQLSIKAHVMGWEGRLKPATDQELSLPKCQLATSSGHHHPFEANLWSKQNHFCSNPTFCMFPHFCDFCTATETFFGKQKEDQSTKSSSQLTLWLIKKDQEIVFLFKIGLVCYNILWPHSTVVIIMHKHTCQGRSGPGKKDYKCVYVTFHDESLMIVTIMRTILTSRVSF